MSNVSEVRKKRKTRHHLCPVPTEAHLRLVYAEMKAAMNRALPEGTKAGFRACYDHENNRWFVTPDITWSPKG